MTHKMFVLFLALAVGCGGSKDDAKPADKPGASAITSDDAYVQAGVSFITRVIGAFKADGKQCDKLANDLDAMLSEPGTKAILAYEEAHPGAKAKLDLATKDSEKQFEAAAGPAVEACADNKKLADVLDKFANL